MIQHQPYDSSMKSLLKEDAADILPRLLPGATLIDILDIEVLRSPMRADRAYRIQYRGKPHIFNLEIQSGADEEVAHRLLIYHAGLWRDYRIPVISMIIYLFQTSIAESPLQEMSGDEELLKFHFRVLPLWTLDARHYVQEHAVSMYTLLPAMRNADAGLLLQAIDDLVEYYKHSEAKLARRLLWLGTFLRRAEILPSQEKQKVKERLDMFEDLLEQDEYVQKQRALGEEIGLARGEEIGLAKGEVLALQRTLVDIASRRFPALTELARQRAERTKQVDALSEIIGLIAVAPNEEMVRIILSSQPAA